jgi:hypothetical protein
VADCSAKVGCARRLVPVPNAATPMQRLEIDPCREIPSAGVLRSASAPPTEATKAVPIWLFHWK